MNILLFGKLGERFGRSVEIAGPPEGCTVAEWRRLLVQKYPDDAEDLSADTARACVDRELAGEQAWAGPGQELAFLPPLSGG